MSLAGSSHRLTIATVSCISILAGVIGQMISPSGPVDVLEGGTISFNCTSDGSAQEDILSQFNRLDIFANQNLLVVTAIPDGAAFTFGPVTVDHDDGRLRCDFILLPMESRFTDEIILNVLSELYILGTICFEILITLINILIYSGYTFESSVFFSSSSRHSQFY